MAHVNPIQVQKYLKGVDYPASKKALLEKAKSMGADENVCASLGQLPDEDFQTPADVSQAFGALPDDGRPATVQRGETAHKEAHQKVPEKAPRSGGGNEFLVQALQDSMAEIQICELALEKLDNADAKAPQEGARCRPQAGEDLTRPTTQPDQAGRRPERRGETRYHRWEPP